MISVQSPVIQDLLSDYVFEGHQDGESFFHLWLLFIYVFIMNQESERCLKTRLINDDRCDERLKN
jgi:hypothetical protein